MKKLSKLKLKEFHEMSDFEMKNVVGGYDLPEVTIYGCYDSWLHSLPTKCTVEDAYAKRRCRTEDCKHEGGCIFAPFAYTPICAY